MSDDDYEYGKVEPVDYIADHAPYDYDFLRKHGVIRFKDNKNRQFMFAALKYFHDDSEMRLTMSAHAEALELLPTKGQWRQGYSTHQLAIWPDKTPIEKLLPHVDFQTYGVKEVGSFKHGCLTWFCIMAHAFFTDAKEKATK